MKQYNYFDSAKNLSALINSLCKEEDVLTRVILLEKMNELNIPYSHRILMPMRKKGYCKISKGLFYFIKQKQPIFYKEFERILLSISNKQVERTNSHRSIKKEPKEVSNISITLEHYSINYEYRY